MSDLVLHIGFPKTGTSTIQDYFWAGQPNYIGRDNKGRCLSGSCAAANELKSILRENFWGPSKEFESNLGSWASYCENLLFDSFQNRENWPETLILSDESLSKWPSALERGTVWPICTGWRRKAPVPRDRPAPIVRLLQEYGQILWPFGNIRVVLTFRTQWEWLASLYSEQSHSIPGASSSDFQNQVERLLETNDLYLDWEGWVEDLKSVLGEENVLALPLEAMNQEGFWSNLADFVGFENVASDPLEKPPKRKRNQGIDSWMLQSLKIRRTLFRDLSYDPNPLLRGGVKLVGSAPFGSLLRQVVDKGRESRLYLNNSLKLEIQEHFSPSNARLAEKLGCNFYKLGYLPKNYENPEGT